MKIECNACGEIVETTARTVKNPYICGECKESREKRAAMAPTEPTPAPSCDSASVEATTELIAALEGDVAAREQQIDFLEGEVVAQKKLVSFLEGRENALMLRNKSLSTTNDGLQSERDEFKQRAEDAGGIISGLIEQVYEFSDAADDANATVSRLAEELNGVRNENATLAAKVVDLQKTNKALGVQRTLMLQEIQRLRDRKREIFGDYMSAREELREIKSRGFWATIWSAFATEY